MKPRVTVCIFVFNQALYITRTLNGLVAQTYPHFKIIACDDGSTDGTYEILKEYEAGVLAGKLTVLTHPGHVNRGAYHTFNACLDHVDTEFFMAHAGDDFWDPDALGYLVELMDMSPDKDFLYGPVKLVDESDKPVWRDFCSVDLGLDKRRAFATFLKNCPVSESSLFFRNSCIQYVKLGAGISFGDWYYFALLFRDKSGYFYQRPVVNYRWHASSTWQKMTREVRADKRLVVFERYYEEAVYRDYPDHQVFLMLCLMAAYAHNADHHNESKIVGALTEHLRKHPAEPKNLSYWAVALECSQIYYKDAYAAILSELPWRLSKHLMAHAPLSVIHSAYVDWRNNASRSKRLKVLLLVLTAGVSSFAIKNIFTASVKK